MTAPRQVSGVPTTEKWAVPLRWSAEEMTVNPTGRRVAFDTTSHWPTTESQARCANSSKLGVAP
jgi:hypothetical protein